MTENQIPGIEQEIERLRTQFSRRPSVDQDRTGGDTPLSVDVVGDTRHYWGATGDVTNGSTTTVFLTWNAKPGGGNVFKKLPRVNVWRDSDSTLGGLARATAPLSPSKNLNLVSHTNYQLKWIGSNEVWAVVVTNDSGSTANFVVTAQGVA